MNLTIQQSKRILANLRYEFHGEGTNVFDYGDIGDKFFMIIDGKASVWVPKKEDGLIKRKKVLKDIDEPLNNEE